jgi:hypothetical protein
MSNGAFFMGCRLHYFLFTLYTLCQLHTYESLDLIGYARAFGELAKGNTQ